MFVTISRRIVLPVTVAGILLALSFCGMARGANPNSGAPMLPLEVHNLTEALAKLKTADTLFQSLLKDIQAIGANPTRVAGKKLSDLHLQLRQLRQAALDLQMLGETAGTDYSLRADVLAGLLGKIQQAFCSTPAGQLYTNQAQQFLSMPKSVQTRQKTVENVQRLLDQDKVEEAFQVFTDLFDRVKSLTVFMDTRTEDSFLLAFASMNHPVTMRRNQAFRQNAQASLEQLAASQMPKTQEVLQAVATAAAALRTSPQADVGGQSLSGPQCLEHFGGVWRQLHLSAVRCRAIEWARITGIPHLSYLSQIEPQQASLPDGVMQQFPADLAKGLASLIEADAQRASETDVPDLYVRYLQSLAPLVASASDDTVASGVQPALERLAGKSAAFATQVKAYRTATQELLRWRERLSRATATGAAAGFQPSDDALLRFFVSEGEFRGLFAPSETETNRAALANSCPQIISTANQRALEKPILVKDLVGLSGGKLAIARYQARHYATLPIPDASAEITRLQQDLILTAQQPALTLEATVAMDSARRGDFVDAGGAVKSFHLEGLIPRFAALRPEAQQLVALGPLPVEIPPLWFISHVLVRFDLEPAWVRHRYFFLSVPQPAAP